LSLVVSCPWALPLPSRTRPRPYPAMVGSIQGTGRPMVPTPSRSPTAFVITRGRCPGPKRISYAPASMWRSARS